MNKGKSLQVCLRQASFFVGICIFLTAISSCSFLNGNKKEANHIIISVDEQKMLVLKQGKPVDQYLVSTSRFGLGDQCGSYRTPLGRLQVEDKIGGGQPSGMVFKGREPTGVIIDPDVPGHDPIVSRILWLRGLEAQNENAYQRYIYIHGTAAEREIGFPTSWGCVRMRSEDVIELYDMIGVGSQVDIIRGRLPFQRTILGRWKKGDEVKTQANSEEKEEAAVVTLSVSS